MIIYGTKETRKVCKLPTPELASNYLLKELISESRERYAGDQLFEWGAKSFYFERTLCLELCNFASRFTILMVAVTDEMVKHLPEYILTYLNKVYEDDQEMLKLLELYADDNAFTYFDKLTNRSVIGSMNHFQNYYLDGGDRLYEFAKGRTIQTVELAKKYNLHYIIGLKVDGKKSYLYPGEVFAKLLKERYQDKL